MSATVEPLFLYAFCGASLKNTLPPRMVERITTDAEALFLWQLRRFLEKYRITANRCWWCPCPASSEPVMLRGGGLYYVGGDYFDLPKARAAGTLVVRESPSWCPADGVWVSPNLGRPHCTARDLLSRRRTTLEYSGVNPVHKM